MYNPTGVAIVTSDEAIRYASLAQLAEHVTVNHGVVGSSPSRGAKTEDHQSVVFCFTFFFHCDEALHFRQSRNGSVCAEMDER